MSTAIFSIRDSIKIGWKLTWKNFWLLLGIFLCLFILGLMPQLVINQFFSGSINDFILVNFSLPHIFQMAALLPVFIGLILLFIILKLVTRIGLMKMTLKIVRHESAEFKDLFVNYKYAINYFLASVLYALIGLFSFIVLAWLGGMVFIGYLTISGQASVILNIILAIVAVAGFILVIIPAMYFLLEYIYASFFIVDHNFDPVNAFKHSAHATHNLKLKLLGFYCVLGLVNLLGLLALGIGLLVTIPMTMLANAHVYDVLSKSVEKLKE